jgi:hypothetical protein
MKIRVSHPGRIEEMKRENFLAGRTYIWVTNGRLLVVRLTKERDGLLVMDGRGDEYYFVHNLVGYALGPINIYDV